MTRKLPFFILLLLLTLLVGCQSPARQHYEAGVSLQEQGFLEEAISEYDEAISLDPALANAYNNRGLAYDQLAYQEMFTGEFDESLVKCEQALKDFDTAIMLNPDYAEAYNNRGNMYHRPYYTRNARPNQREQVIQDFDDAIRLKPDYAEAYYNRGFTYWIATVQREQAIYDFNEAIRLKPNYVEAYCFRGCAYTGLGKYTEAISDFEQCIRLSQTTAVSESILGTARKHLEHLKKLIEE
jgi:tetratricopeptide (TPR) repeat protein